MFEVEARDRGWETDIFINGRLADMGHKLFGVRSKAVFTHEGRKYVVKLGMQSQAEWYFLENIVEESDKRYFMDSLQGGLAPYYDSNGKRRADIGYIIQEFVTFERGAELHRSHWNVVQYIIEKYKLRDLDGVSGDEGRNWSVVNGQPVIYDWGLGAHHDAIC